MRFKKGIANDICFKLSKKRVSNVSASKKAPVIVNHNVNDIIKQKRHRGCDLYAIDEK
jgi:hypothetical protein